LIYEGANDGKNSELQLQVWTSVVVLSCDLRGPEAHDLIGQWFQAGLIDEMAIDPASYQESYQRSLVTTWP